MAWYDTFFFLFHVKGIINSYFNVYWLGKISLKELQQSSVENLNAYFDQEKLSKPRLRSHNSQQVWLWHDDDELLQYEGLLEDYHER